MSCASSPKRLKTRDQSRSDRIIFFPHPHPHFFVECGAEWILYGCGNGCRFFRMLYMVRSRIGVGADAD
jgi:hypothetical protein